ncbi:MAG: hypothetical protein U9R75_06665, partial [Candidatus Thermoplasmatota archaeon]|nr:hypothetical protein [Candidatus Thermoplasmatota archaeon]
MRKYTTMAVIVTAILMLTMTVSSSANLFYPEDIEDHDSFYAVAPTMFQDINGTYWMGFIHIKDEERNIGICHSRDMVNWSDPIVVESNVYLHSSNIVFFQGQDGFYNLIYRECFITNPDASIDHMLIRSSNGRDWGDPAHISESGYTKSVIQLSSGGYRMASCGLSWIHCALSDDLYEWSYRIIEDPDFTNEASPSFPYLYQDSDGRILLTYTYGSADNEAPQQVYLMY